MKAEVEVCTKMLVMRDLFRTIFTLINKFLCTVSMLYFEWIDLFALPIFFSQKDFTETNKHQTVRKNFYS